MFGVKAYCEKVLRSKVISKGVSQVLVEVDRIKLRELVLIDYENDFDCFSYLVCLILIKVYEEAPLGVSAVNDYLQYYKWLKGSGQEFSSLLDPVIIKWYEKEIRASKDIEEILLWLDLTLQLQEQYQLDIQPIKTSAFFPVIQYSWVQMALASCPNNIESTCKFLHNIRLFQSFEVIENQIVSLVFNSMYRYMNIEYDIEGTMKIFGREKKGDLGKALRVLKELNGIELSGSDLKSFNRLVKGIFVRRTDQLILGVGGKNQAGLEDFRDLEFKEIIFSGSTQQFEVKVYLATHPHKGNLAVKEYKAKINLVDLSIHYQEIEVLERLSSLASSNNCFPLFFGYFSSGNSLFILTEYHPQNLMSTISEYKNQGLGFSTDYLLFTTTKLLNSLAIIKTLKIFHGSLKPQIFLVTPEFDLKITDFSAKVIKTQISTFWHTSEHNIQDTSGYEAPELSQHYGQYKAEVFSLGLILLQMATQQDLSYLNTPANHPQLTQKINSVSAAWLRTLLTNMLDLDPKTRQSFESLSLSVPH